MPGDAMTTPTDTLANVLRADMASLEARLGTHRRSLRRSVRTYRRALREPEEHEARLAQVRAAIHHDKAISRIHAAKLAEARTRLAEISAARSAA